MKNLHNLAIGVGSFRAAKFFTSYQANYREIIFCIVGCQRHLVFLKCYFQWWFSTLRFSLFI